MSNQDEKSKVMRFSIVVLSALWVGSGLAIAQPLSPQIQTAQVFFTRGNTAYNLRRFEEAATLFSKAYEAWPQSEFLYNIAQAYRLARNCDQALYFYRRFLSLKEQDTTTPLSQKKRGEVETFIRDLTKCVANAEVTTVTPPHDIEDPPRPAPKVPVPSATPTRAATSTMMPPNANPEPKAKDARHDLVALRTTTTEHTEDENDDDISNAAVAARPPSVIPQFVVARLTGGVAMISAGDLSVPAQPVLGLSGGYPIHIAPLTVEFGAALSYLALPYAVMNEHRKRAGLLGVRATAVVSYPVASKLSIRGHLGFGIVSLSRLAAGNPIALDYQATSFTLPSVGFGLAVDYKISSSIVVSVSPLSMTVSPGADGTNVHSLRELDVAIGVGYQR